VNRFCRDKEEEPFTEFQEEGFKFVDYGGFDITFGVVCFLIEPEKFKDNGILEYILRLFDNVAFLCEISDTIFIPAECEALIDSGVELSFEFQERPLVLSGFDLIKPALILVVNIHEEDVVGPAESEPGYELARHCLTN
jgi:hypothetical protein